MTIKMKIADIRQAIRRARYSRDWLTGGTLKEFQQQTVDVQLQEKIDELRALVIPARFAGDISDRDSAIEQFEATIKRWQSLQGRTL